MHTNILPRTFSAGTPHEVVTSTSGSVRPMDATRLKLSPAGMSVLYGNAGEAPMITNTDNDDVRAIGAVRSAVEAAENAGDASAAAMLLADDAVLMVPDFPVQEGRDACVRFMRDVMAWLTSRFDRRIAYVSAEVAVLGDMAFDRGTFAFTVSPKSGGDIDHVTGKYFWLLRRTAASWRIARLIVSRDDATDADESAAVDVETSVDGV